MILATIDDPGALWQYAERYLGVGTRTYSAFAADLDVSPAYHPQLGRATVPVPSFRIPRGEGTYLRNGAVSALHELYRDGGGFLLPVHPDALTSGALVDRDRLLACEPGPVFEVVPSANARTVSVERIGGSAVPRHFLKLHYPRRLSRFTRRLRRPVIELQLWVADELAAAGIPVLAEVGGAVFGDDPVQAWGYLLRERRPAGGGGLLDVTVPLFALYGRDYHAPADPTLLEQLIARSGEEPAGYLARRVIEPAVRLWVLALRATGCILESHGQNLLYSSTLDGTRSAVGYRDCGIYVDAGLRAAAGLTRALPPTNVVGRDIDLPPEQVRSLAYDSFLGHHTLSYLAELARTRYGVAEHVLHEAARRAFAENAGDRPLLPPTVYYYDGALCGAGEVRLVDTGRVPCWR